MKKGMSMQELATQVATQEQKKRDLIVPTNRLEMQSDGDSMMLTFNDESSPIFHVRSIAHDQISERLGIPRAYYKRMKEAAPDLLAQNVNHWFGKKQERRLVRFMDADIRAYLSDRFMIRDNYPILSTFLRVLKPNGGDIEVMSANLTERSMYIQVISHNLVAEVVPGQPVYGGITLSNSEVGMGAVNIAFFLYVQICTNGMMRESVFRKLHIGRGLADTDEVKFLSNDTINKLNLAFIGQVEDMLKLGFSKDRFNEEIQIYKGASREEVRPSKIDDVIEDITGRFSLTKAEGSRIQDIFLDEGDYSKWGLSMAITQYANEIEDYDRTIDLQKVGGNVFEIPKATWAKIAA